ncbi:fumarate reductase subunit D [mine drainage metagenome]|uniref:Fumarate reductase subunit D n=1 Tax=mine drainage metagenome TaxID=410659 RepID=A0A1J5RTE5_9ZZZZ
MAKSNKPIIWGTFAAGGELVSFVTPVLIVLTLLAATGHVPDMLGYDRLHQFAAGWFGKLVIFVVLFLSLWSQAHRLRITFYDFGARADTLVATVVYALAAAGSVATLVFLARLG